jgi:hypothetical protein
VPVTGEHALKNLDVQVAPKLWQPSAAAEDAKEGQDQRHGRGLLETGTPCDLRSKTFALFWLPDEPALDKRFDVVWVAKWLEVADSVSFVLIVDGELVSPRASPTGEDDPP